MSMRAEKMGKRSIGSLMRKKLSDITNSHSQQDNHPVHPLPLDTYPSDKDCIQQLLKERATLIQLLAERNKTIEMNGAELQRLRADVKKLQLQNWNLAQSNTHMLAEVNLGREKIKTLQHEILWRAALIKGKTLDLQEKVEIDSERNASFSQSQQEGDEKPRQPSPKASNDEQHSHMNRRRIRNKSTGSSTASAKNTSKDKVKDNRRSLRRHSATFKTHEHEPLENLFKIEDAQHAVEQSGLNMLSSPAVKTATGESSVLRNEAPRYSFGRPLRRAAVKVQSYKETPLNVKMRRLD